MLEATKSKAKPKIQASGSESKPGPPASVPDPTVQDTLPMTESQVENAFQDLAQPPPAPSTETGLGLEHTSVKDEPCEQAEEEAMTDDDVVEPILTHGDAQNVYFSDSQLASPQTAQDSEHPDSLPQDSQPPVESQIPTDSLPVMPSDSQVQEPQPQDMLPEEQQQTEQAGVTQHHQNSEEKSDNQETPKNPESPIGAQVNVLDSDEEDGKKKTAHQKSQESKVQKGTFKEHKHISSCMSIHYQTFVPD